MTDPDQDEFVALRRRAYARDSDIHLDPHALARLAELERAHRPVVAESAVPEAAVPLMPSDPSPVPPVVPVESTAQEASPPTWWTSVAHRLEPLARAVRRWVLGLRRSTVLIALGAALIVACLVTALTLVQRVQSDPLQVGAVQVARLGVDHSYESPFPASYNPAPGDGEIRGYREFHGLRVVRDLRAFFYPYDDGSTSECFVLYVVSTLEVSSGGFGGSIYSACSAGEFPAILQFPLDSPELPDELAEAYPDADGVQFVYDRENDEVVVFVDR